MKMLNFLVNLNYFKKFCETDEIEKYRPVWARALRKAVKEYGFKAEITYCTDEEGVCYEFFLRGKWNKISYPRDEILSPWDKIALYLADYCGDEDESEAIYDDAVKILFALWPLAAAEANKIAEEAIAAADNKVRKFIDEKKEQERESKWDETTRLMLDAEGRE